MMRHLIAILRDISTDEIEAVAEVLLQAGICKIEVPLNSPDPFRSIQRLCLSFADQGLFGAGTVLNVEQVYRLEQLGAQMIISPNCDVQVIRATKAANLLSYPGVMTPSECFLALEMGADGLKFFPSDIIGVNGLRAVQTVLPNNTDCIAVGGLRADNLSAWMVAGATGFGIGSMLYKAGDSLEKIKANA